MPEAGVCRCGHDADAHRHYRPGSDCSLCAGTCPRYRPDVRWWRRAGGVLGALRPARRTGSSTDGGDGGREG